MSNNRNFKIYSLLSILLFLTILIAPSFLWGLGILLPNEHLKILDYDLGENRNKTPFPEYFSSTYGAELEAYYNDHLPFRSIIISANRKLTTITEAPYDKIISPYLVKTFYNTPDPQPETVVQTETVNHTEDLENIPEDTMPEDTLTKLTATSSETPPSETTAEIPPENDVVLSKDSSTNYVPPKLLNNTTILGQNGWLFLALENALDDYLGSNILTSDEMDEYLNKMLQLQNICALQGKKVYYIILPNKSQVYSEQMPSYTLIDEYKRTQRLTDYINANSDIPIIYPLKEMTAAKNKLQLYFKTDTHWNEAGAFIGVQALYSLIGMSVTDIQNVSFSPQKFNNGDLIKLGNLNSEDYDDISYITNYKPEISVNNLDGTCVDDVIYKSASTSANPHNAVLVGDSYRVFMSNYLSKDFNNYTHIHNNNLADPAAINAIKNADIIVVESVERLSHTLLSTTDHICEILNQ